MSETNDKKTGLALLREPFPAHQVSKLPKGTKEQNNCQAAEKVNCRVCGGWHHPKTVHLDYVGHAALTDRLLDADIGWTWEPMALKDGLPAFDETGGLWIRLTVCGQTRIGYGHAAESSYKDIGSREKEVIGDALRNAAMRFGAALELWHKGELHLEDEPEKTSDKKKEEKPPEPKKTNLSAMSPEDVEIWCKSIREADDKKAEAEKAKAACKAIGDTAAWNTIKESFA